MTATIAFIGVALAAVIIAEPSVRKVGGITFVKVGRFGGSFYWSKK